MNIPSDPSHVLAVLSDGYGSIPIHTIFSGLFTSINPSYFDVNKKGVLLVLTHCQMSVFLVLPMPHPQVTTVTTFHGQGIHASSMNLLRMPLCTLRRILGRRWNNDVPAAVDRTMGHQNPSWKSSQLVMFDYQRVSW